MVFIIFYGFSLAVNRPLTTWKLGGSLYQYYVENQNTFGKPFYCYTYIYIPTFFEESVK